MEKNRKCPFCNSFLQEKCSNERLEVYRWVYKYGSIQKERKTIDLSICESCYRKLHPIRKPYAIAAYVSMLAPLLLILTLCSKGAYINFGGGVLLFVLVGGITYSIIFTLFFLAISFIQDAFTPSMDVKPFCDLPSINYLRQSGFHDYLGDRVRYSPPAFLDPKSILPFEVIKEELEKKYSCVIK